MSQDMERTELIAREEIRDLLARYTWAGDRGRATEVADCFTPDGQLDVGSDGGVWTGKATIESELRAVADRVAASGTAPTPVNHHVSSIAIHLEDPTTATVRSYFCVYTDVGPDHWGSYRDRVVQDQAAGGWRFAERKVRVTGASPGSRFRN